MTQCNRMGWCLSGNATRGVIDRIRKDFDRDVRKAKENIEVTIYTIKIITI